MKLTAGSGIVAKMTREKYELYRFSLPAITQEPLAPNGKWLYLSPKWFGLIQSLIGELEHPKVWQGTKEDIQKAIFNVIEIEMQQLEPDCEDCPDNSTNEPTIPPFWGITYDELEDLISELENDMCGKCDLSKMLRLKNGVLEVCVNDPCEGVKWVAINEVGSGGVGQQNSALGGLAGSSVGAGLLTAAGSAAAGAVVKIPPSPFNNTPNKSELRKCNKATRLVDATLGLLEVIYDIDSPANNLIDLIPENLTDFIMGTTGIFLSKLPPPLGGYVRAVSLAYWLDELKEEAKDDIVSIVEDKVIRREQAICYLSQTVSLADEIVGQDLVDALVGLGVLSSNLTQIGTMWTTVDIEGLYKYFADFSGAVDCGCPEIVNRANYDPTGTSTIPELADWYAIADFKTHQPSYYGFSVEYGDWVSGEGLNGNYDSAMTRNFAFIYMGASGASVLERVDVSLSNVVRGQFFSGEGTPDNDIEGFFCRYRFFGGVPLAVKPITTPSTSVIIGSKATQITLQFMFGYDERDPNVIPDQTGFGTITQVKVWGRGAVPPEYNNWSVTNV